MHEYSLVQALLERVQAEAKGRGATKVERISVRIGDFAGVERALFATAFEAFKAGGLCAEATLEIASVEGDDLLLDRIQLEVPDV